MKRYLLPIILAAALLVLPGATQRGPSALAANGQPAPQASPSAQPRYTVADLGTLGGVTTKGMGINENGRIVGASQSGSYLYGFLWDGNTMTNLGDLGGQGSWAYDINEAGQVVGGSPLASGENHAFLWDGSMQDLGTLGGTTSYAFEINASGQAVGYACCAPDTYLSHAVLWGSGGIVDLGDLDPLWPAHSAAYGINDAGQVVGGSYDASANFHAFLWQNSSMQDLGTLGGDYSSAEAINETGQVVGVARLANGTPHAFLWDGGMQDLGALTWDQSIAYDINDKGQVVGALQTGQNSHAFVWANGQMQDLNNLIPADSGWVLQEARAINNKGRIVGFGTINGQTRAFLLTPQAYHWTNPSGGAWHLTSNWDPPGDPGAGDTVIFDLNGQYTVNASTLAASASPSAPQFSIDRMVISSTNFVYFDNMDLNMVYDSPEEPSLEVVADGTAAVNSGAATFSHAIIGGEPPANPSNPPLARLQVLGNGASLTGSGCLTIGDEGAGELFVTAGGQLTSAEARIGGLLATGTGVADVGGDGSLWDTGNIAVGYGVSGTLTIQYGGRVNSNDAYVSWGALSEDSNVIVNSISANTSQPSMWALLGSLTVGQIWFGSVEVLDGGDLYVSQDVYIKNGELNIEGRHANGDPSDLDVLGSVFVGGAGSANLLALRNAAKGDIEGDLIIGKDGSGAAILWGSAVTTDPTWLEVVDPQAGLCVIGWVYDGGVSLDDGGLFRCRNIQLGQAGTSGAGYLTVDGGMVRALDVLQVGTVGGGSGVVEMENNALVATNGTYIAPNGVISGTGTLAVNFLGLQNDGTLAPGINVLYPLASAAAFQSAARTQDETATLAISGTLTIGPSGRLAIPLIGNSAGQYGSLSITGTANLAGVLALDFQGFAPQQGDTFTFLAATEGISGAFDSAEISGLAPGFEYELAIVDGQVMLEALNDGVPLGRVFLPLVVR
jgi:probable HAF family extracellular repeat protein/T5SS/PEP-CTERM-associated repeat protein